MYITNINVKKILHTSESQGFIILEVTYLSVVLKAEVMKSDKNPVILNSFPSILLGNNLQNI